MNKSPDRFSEMSGHYRKYRPDYPEEMLEEIISLAENRECSWDCGTGNGQVAKFLSRHFNKVHASDISKEQIGQAYKAANIEYLITRSEDSGLAAHSIDLITVAQALHWFDFDAFFKEVRRVANSRAVIAVWGYGLLSFGDETDQLINDFYQNILNPYWDPHRKHVENAYRSIPFPFQQLSLKQDYEIVTQFNLNSFAGYLATWSSVRNFIAEKKFDPVEQFERDLASTWRTDETKTARFPIFTKIGIVEK